MTDARPPGEQPEDRLLREIARYWEDVDSLADPGQLDRIHALMADLDGPDAPEARAELTDVLLDLLPQDHPLARSLRTGTMFRGPVTETVPVTIYLSDERIHEQVEAAVEKLLASVGLQIVSREDPVAGSWFRRMVAREVAATALHAADGRVSLDQDAQRTAILLQGLPNLLGALQPTKDAVVRVGTLLVVKVDGTVSVIQLTAAQQLSLDHAPHLVYSPAEIAKLLNTIQPEEPGARPAHELSPPEEPGWDAG
jgi:hypothetical protein